jgi:hypothetical protein
MKYYTEENEGFMEMSNDRRFRSPQKEVYVEIVDIPMDLSSDNIGRVKISDAIEEEVDYNQDRIRAKMTQSYRNPKKLLEINPATSEFLKEKFNYGGKVNQGLSFAETIRIAKQLVNVLGKDFSITKGTLEPASFDLDYKGVKYDGGSYLIMTNGDVVNVALPNRPAYYNYINKNVYINKLYDGGFMNDVYAGGGKLKRIDMNKNGKIDAEDFKILRSSMNGAWRNERKHVNHNEDYEKRYAKNKPNRSGYKGKRNFEEGGGLSKFEKLSRVVAKNYEGKQVKPQYQKEYGKTYSKEEAKEVGDKVAGKVKAMQSKKMFFGGFNKQTEKFTMKGKDGMTKDGKAIKILSDDGDSVLAIELNKIGTGSKPMRINKSELDIYTFE